MSSWVKVADETPKPHCLITLSDAMGGAATCEACGQEWVIRDGEWHREATDDRTTRDDEKAAAETLVHLPTVEHRLDSEGKANG